MKKYEYQYYEIPTAGSISTTVDIHKMIGELNDLGQKGWEVATSLDINQLNAGHKVATIILKREIQ
ncbi:DUF4177 domain-containing protein [Deminuibacter soli]|uniref:DUF4177 domain-containing protein n=1 Tax=Deminuibacter soli TaxID=2291815 RepID=A0A3E1NJL6_9BACT|nr:DUF4177 domain-containing protein [Deminuibacter soli]RFM28119.1 DUF4177 domain-containing protein [Deminuibacter soli]